MRPPNRRERSVLRFLCAVASNPLFFAVVVALLIAKPPHALLPLFALLSSGTTFMDTNGAIVLNDDGERYMASGTSDACPCDCCVDCPSCSDGVPAAYIITLVGVNICNSMCRDGGITSTQTTGTLNTTYTVTCSTECQWGPESINTGITSRYYDNDDCTGNITFSAGPSGEITLTKGASFSVSAFLVGDVSCGVFEGNTANVATCQDAAGYTATNGLTTAGDCDTGGCGAADGTADIDLPA